MRNDGVCIALGLALKSRMVISHSNDQIIAIPLQDLFPFLVVNSNPPLTWSVPRVAFLLDKLVNTIIIEPLTS